MSRAEFILKFAAAAVILATSYLTWGCSAKVTEYYPVYTDVYIPVKCNVGLSQKPAYLGEAVFDNLNILKYAEELEAALNFCTK